MQLLQDSSQSNVDNLNNVRRDVSRLFRKKKKEHLKAKIEELETDSKIKNIRDLFRDINDFKKGYQPRTTDFYIILDRWRNHFSQLFNVHYDSDVRQTETHAAEPLVPEPSAFEIEVVTEELITRY